MTDSAPKTLAQVFLSVHEAAKLEIHSLCEVIYHIKGDGVQITLHVPTSDASKPCFSSALIEWDNLMGATESVLIDVISKLGGDIRAGIGKLKYEKCVVAGVIADAVEWNLLPESAREMWSKKGFDPSTMMATIGQ